MCAGDSEKGRAGHFGFGWRALAFGICFALLVLAVGAILQNAAATAYTISLDRVVRTSASDASVLGTSNAINKPLDVLVNGAVAKSGTTFYQGDFWVLGVPVSNGATVQIRIIDGPDTSLSNIVVVPNYTPHPVGPADFIYASGSKLMLNNASIQLFGVDDQYPFIYALLASGLWPPGDPASWGLNGLFPELPNCPCPPAGPNTCPLPKISGVTDVESLWLSYFRYFLHYNAVASPPNHPITNVLRIWVADDSWNADGLYQAWTSNPTAFWNLFDRMVYWAKRADVYLVPVLGHLANELDHTWFDRTSTHYAHKVAVVRAIMDRYNSEPQIAMWDLWNEPDVNQNSWWGGAGGGINGFRAWASGYIADVKPNSSNHLITMGIGGWTSFPGAPDFGWKYHFFFNEIAGLEVSHHHTYMTAEDQYLVDWPTDWHTALGVPHYEGEFGYNEWRPLFNCRGYGYWPWYANRTRVAGWPAVSTMVYQDNGKGAYTDYPYFGALPSYPPGVLSVTRTSFPLPLTVHNVQMPATVASGDLLIVFFATDGTPSVIAPMGWTFFFGWDSWGGTGNKFSMYAKRAAGTEGGTLVNFATSLPVKATAQVFRITGWRDSGILSNDVEWANAGALDANPDPSSLNPVHWDVENTLWIASYGADDDYDATSYPANYAHGTYTESDASDTSTSLGTARRTREVAAEDPGPFTISASVFWISSTVAVRPA